MWMRRVFYDPTTGEVFRIFSADGNFRLLSQYDEAAICGLSDYACLELSLIHI